MAATRTTAKSGGKSNTSRDELLRFYREMLLIRRFEEKAGQLYGMGLIGGFCHLYIGQEAVAIGMQHALSEGDSVITAYRDHGHMLATGMDPRRVMAELTGRATGYSKGKGGSLLTFATLAFAGCGSDKSASDDDDGSGGSSGSTSGSTTPAKFATA
jgi:pyruvate dehydrogenase E1 component alpha subunit